MVRVVCACERAGRGGAGETDRLRRAGLVARAFQISPNTFPHDRAFQISVHVDLY